MTKISIDSSEIDELTRLIERYPDSWKLNDHVVLLGNGRPDGYLAHLLWTAHKANVPVMQQANVLLRHFSGAPALWDASDFLGLYDALQTHFPGGECNQGSSGWWSDGDIPGMPWGMKEMLEEKKGDATLAAALRDAWKDLPEPWRLGLGYHLAAFGMMPHTELEAADCTAIARVHLENGGCSSPHAMPADAWGPLLVQTASAEADKLVFDHAGVLADLLPHATPEQLVAAIGCCRHNSSAPDGLTALDDMGEEQLPVFEQALIGRAVEPPDPDGGCDGPAWPHALYAFSYLRLCRRADHTPPESIDGYLSAVLGAFYQPWGGGGVADYHRLMWEALEALPLQRLEAALLASKQWTWSFAPACATPKILETITEKIRALPARLDYDQETLVANLTGRQYNDFHDGMLRPVARALVPHAIEALCAAKPAPQRHVFVWVLAVSDDPSALEGLLIALSDKGKAIREMAREALQKLEPARVLPALETLLDAKRKDVRREVATILVALSPNDEAYALAQRRLETEKVDAVVDLLSQVAPASAGDKTTERALLEALLASDGADWQSLEAEPAALLEALARALLESSHEEFVTEYSTLYEPWLAALRTHVGEQSAVVALSVLGGFSEVDGDRYLDALNEIFDDLSSALVAWLASEGDLARPIVMGKAKYCLNSYGIKELVDWLASNAKAMTAPLVTVLDNRLVSIRKRAVDALVAQGEASLPALHVGLSSPSSKIRKEAALVLGRLGNPASRELVEGALANERDDAARGALTQALQTLEAESLDISAFAATTAGHGALDAALARLPSTAPSLPLNELPALRWTTGEKLSADAQAWVIGAACAESLQHESRSLRAVSDRLSQQSRAAVVDAALRGERQPFVGWAVYLQGVLGGPAHIDAIAGQLETLASSQRTNWGADGVAALVRAGSDAAIRHLDHARRKGRRNALRERADRGLLALAAIRGMELEDLLDAAVSDLGFDSRGEFPLDLGPRTITARLQSGGALVFIDEKGKSRKSLPTARKSDDAEKAAEARARAAATKRELKRIAASQAQRFEDALRNGRCWPLATWKERFIDHALMRSLARGLLWELVDGVQLMLDANGEPMGRDGVSLAIPDVSDSDVRLVHPVNLDDAALAGWRSLLDGTSIEPLIEQLTRPVFRPEDVPADDRALFTSLPIISAGRFMRGLSQLGYERGPRGDAGLINDDYRSAGEYLITLQHNSYSPELPDEKDMELQGIMVQKGNESSDWRSLPPRVLSEVLRDIHILMGT